jgi:hypothetical protein
MTPTIEKLYTAEALVALVHIGFFPCSNFLLLHFLRGALYMGISSRPPALTTSVYPAALRSFAA